MTRILQRNGAAAAILLLGAVSLCGWSWQLNDYGVVRPRPRTARAMRLDDTDHAHEQRIGLQAPDPKPAVGLPAVADPLNDDTDGTAPVTVARAHPRFNDSRSAFRFSLQGRPLPAGRNRSSSPRGPPSST